MVTLHNVRTYEKSADLLMGKSPFHCPCREICQNVSADRDRQFTLAMLMALQETTGYYLEGPFEDTDLCAINEKSDDNALRHSMCENIVFIRTHKIYGHFRPTIPSRREYS